MRRRLAAACAAAAVLAILLFALLPGRAALKEMDTRLAKAGEGLTDYTVTLRLDDREDALAISETVLYRNDTGSPLSTLMVRTWLNAFRRSESSPAALEELYDVCYPEGFSPGSLTIYDVLWNGERAAYAYMNEDQSALEIQIPVLESGGQGELPKFPYAVTARARRAGITSWATCCRSFPCIRTARGARMRTAPWAIPS